MKISIKYNNHELNVNYLNSNQIKKKKKNRSS